MGDGSRGGKERSNKAVVKKWWPKEWNSCFNLHFCPANQFNDNISAKVRLKTTPSLFRHFTLSCVKRLPCAETTFKSAFTLSIHLSFSYLLGLVPLTTNSINFRCIRPLSLLMTCLLKRSSHFVLLYFKRKINSAKSSQKSDFFFLALMSWRILRVTELGLFFVTWLFLFFFNEEMTDRPVLIRKSLN